MNNRPQNPDPETTADCIVFEVLFQRVLDGELAADRLHAPHATTCAACRQLRDAATLFARFPTPVPKVSFGFNQQILSAVQRDRRQRQQSRYVVRGAALAMAACLLISVGIYFIPSGKKPAPEVVEVTPKPAATNPPRVSDQVAEAGSALSAMTLRVTEQTITPTRSLFPTDRMTMPLMEISPEVDPAAASLAALPSAAKSGIEPITDSTRRAVNLFLRDVGFSPKSKS